MTKEEIITTGELNTFYTLFLKKNLLQIPEQIWEFITRPQH